MTPLFETSTPRRICSKSVRSPCPDRARAFFKSDKVRTPLSETFRALKASRKCLVSSVLSWSAIACRAAFFKVECIRNSRKRFMQLASCVLTLAVAWSRNHPWPNACSAEYRCTGFRLISTRSKCLASVDTLSQIGPDSETVPCLTLFSTSCSVLPVNAAFPLRRVNKMTPQDQRSHRLSYRLRSTCGATYCAVPTICRLYSPG
mmetsp:Transcript_20900/g.59231  ORF Transcript_20900/g.59231 Transcript_20900/m.59231 type:complete len:204 (-) Transcript_20900:100-711(-)